MTIKATSGIAAILLCAVASSALAGTNFQTYEGPDSITEGHGGTRETDYGVDFWTTGTPPRKYQVIGVLTDDRKRNAFHHDAVGSEKVAKAVKDVGGDAVIMQDQSDRTTGFMSNHIATYGYNNAFGTSFATPLVRSHTQFIVIKYLTADAPPK